eukprot:SAG31_NODE_13386_length_873_cov_1.080103_2_plen_30_part_01
MPDNLVKTGTQTQSELHVNGWHNKLVGLVS